MLPRDTDEAADAAQRRLIMAMTPSQRVERVLELSQAIRDMQFADVRRRYPDADHRAVVKILVKEVYGIALP
jgi:hypothetical protein